MKSELRNKIANYEKELKKAQSENNKSKIMYCEHEIDNLLDILNN